MNPLLIALAAFVAAVAAAVSLSLHTAGASERPESRIRKRLRSIRSGEAGEPRTERALLKDERAGATAWPDRLFAQLEILERVDELVRKSETRFSAGTILLVSVVSAVFLPAFVHLALGFPVLVAVFVGLLGAAAPYFWLRRKVSRRRRRFLEQMPDGLDTISQGLQAGLGLGHAQVFLAEEAAEPMKSEFSIFLQEMNLGLPLRDAVVHLEERMPLHEIRLFSTALLVQREVGGSLSEVLIRLGDVIRDRFRIEQEIRSLTAQNRMTAWVVCSLPLVLTFLMFLLNPAFMREIVGHPIGRAMLTMAAGMWITGALVFWRLLKIHV